MIFDFVRKLFVPSAPSLQDRPAVAPVGVSRRTFFSFATVGTLAITHPGMFLSPFQKRLPLLTAGLREEFAKAYAERWVAIGHITKLWSADGRVKVDLKLNDAGWKQFAHGLADGKLKLDLENKSAVLPDVDILDSSKMDLADMGKMVYSRGDGKLSMTPPPGPYIPNNSSDEYGFYMPDRKVMRWKP